MSKTEILCINVNDATVKEYIKEFGELAVAKAMTKWNEMGYDDLPPKSIMGSLKELTIKESNGEEAIDSFRSLQTAVRKEKAIPLYNRLATDRAIDVSIENYGTAKAAIEKNIKLDDQAKEEATSRLAEQFVKENHKFMIGDGDSKMDQFKQKLRSLYEKMKSFKNDSEVEKMLMLLSRDKNYLGEGKSFSSDFKASITKLYEEGVDEQNQQKIELAKRLFSKTNSELISLFSYSKSNRFIPYIKFFPGNSKQPVKISNSNLEVELGNIAFEHISQWKDSQVNGLISRQLDNAKNTFEDDALFLQKLTGIEVKHWENYAKSKTWDYKKITKNQLLKSFIMRDKVTGPIKTKEQLLDKLIKAQGINKGSAINTISINTPIEDKINPNNLSSRFKNAKFNTKSTARLSTQVSDRLESLGGNFDYSKSFYKDNAFVNQWKENTPIVAGIDGHSVKKGDDYVSEQADNLADEDLFNTIQMMFDKQTTIAREGNYMQNVGQFGDKGDLLFVEMKRYDDIKEVEKLYIERLKKQKFKWIEDGKSVYKTLTDAEAKLVVASIKADGQTHFKGTLDERHLMAMNYAYGFNLVNEFINGKNEQYGKPDKGKDGKIYFKTSPLVDMFKRNGSQNSPGMIGDEDVEGGLGKGFRHLVVNIPEMDGAHLMDGQRFVRRTHSDKVNKSYGSVFNFGTVIKAISTLTDEKGNRFMDKSGAIVIDEFVADLKSKGIDGTVYQNLLEFMEKHDVESVSTTDTTKFTGGKKALKMFEGDKFVEPTFTNIDDHVYFIPTSEYRVQQDLVNDGKFYESTVPIQRMKNMMHIADAPAIAEMYNRIGAQKIDKIINVLKTTSTKEWRAYILGELNFNESEINDITEENEREEGFGDITEIEKLLAGGVEFEHVWVQNWLHTFMANTITKQALGRVTNKALAVEMAYLPSEKFKLKDYVIKDKKVYLPEAMVPYNSKLREPKKVSSKEEAIKTIKSNAGKYMDMFTGFDGKGKPIGIHEHEIEVLEDGSAIIPGEFFLYTRIPADAMHSTTLARVKGRLPKQMGNVIITNFASQQMAGSDFDGDQRHIEGFFKNTTKKVVKGKEQKLVRVDINEETKHGIANKAFHMEAQAFYNVANHKSFTNPINTSHYDSILENLPKDKMKRQDSGTAFVDARTKNNVGLACVGINANMQSVGDYIKAHDSFVKIQKERKSDKQFSPLRLPIITIKDGVFTLKDSKVIASFTQDEKVKDALGDFQNLSLDNVKDPKIERLGLNEVSAKMFNTAMVMKPDDVDVDVWAESIIAFFNLPTVKEYVNRVRQTKRINSDVTAEDVFGIMAEELNGDKYINTERDVNLTKEDLTSTKSMNVLRKLKVLNDLTFDLDKIHSLIRLTEKAPKSWAELEVAKQNLEAIEGNLLKYVDTSEFISRPFIQSAKDALKAADAYFDKFANETTNEAVRLKEEFELEWKENNDPDKPLFKQMKRKQMEAFSSAVKSMMLTNSRKRDTKYEQWASTFVNTVKKMKESGKKNPIVDALQYNNNKLELREDLKRSDITEYEKQQIDKEFERLESSTLEEDKQFLKDLVDYNIFTTGLSASAPSGSYAVLFPMYVHKEIGLAMKEEKARWDAGFTDEQFNAIYNEMFDENIILQSPKAEKNLKGKTIYEPFFRKNAEIVALNNRKSEESSTFVREYTPENITSLKPNEVFVFGANTAGGHGGGTAGLAQRGTTTSNYTALPIGTKGKWSEYGIVDKLMQGTEGKSFGIVTKAATISGTSLKIGAKRSVPLRRIEESINALIVEANNHPELKFLVTKFGTNMAGFSEKEMKSLLENKNLPDNVILPKEFEVRDNSKTLDDKKVIKVAGTKVINSEDIDSFKQYLSKSNDSKPKEFFTATTKFKEFFNPETGKKEKSPQSSKWILNSDGYYDLVDKEGGEVYITDVDLTTGYQMIVAPKKEEAKEKEKKEMKSPSDFKGYSGAAIGSDKLWSLIGKKFGIGKQVDYTPNDLQKLTEEQRKEVESAYLKAVKDLGRGVMKYNWANPQKEDYRGGLVRRDYLQAKAGDAVFAISAIIEPGQKDKTGVYVNKTKNQVVDGGTAYAVQMAINLGKPVYVFDQLKNKWFEWNGKSFSEIGTPTLTPKFAAVGTREINDAGKQAIQDVYENTFGTQEIEIPKRTDELSKIDAKNFEILVRILSDVNNLNQRQKDALKDVNLKTLKPTAGNFGLLQKIKCL